MSTRTIVLIISGAVVVTIALAIFIGRIFSPPVVTQPAVIAVLSINPVSAATNSIVRSPSISGTGFVSGAQVSLERQGTSSIAGTGFALVDNVLTGGSFELGGASPGVWTVVVVNPDGSRGECAGCFTVTPENPAPTFTTFSLDRIAQGGHADAVITGTGFLPGMSVAFSGGGITVDSNSQVSSTEMHVSITLSATAPLEARNITVTNPDLKTAQCVRCLMVTAGPPTVTAVAPSAQGVGGVKRPITISGTGFQQGAKVVISGTGVTSTETTVVSPTQLSTFVTLATTTAVGSRDVTVINTDGLKSSCVACLIVNPAPIVRTVAPATAVVGTAVDALFSGSSFHQAMTIAFSGVGITISDFVLISETQFTARLTLALNAFTGVRDLIVSNSDGGSSVLRSAFTITPQPIVVPPPAATTTTSTAPVATTTTSSLIITTP